MNWVFIILLVNICVSSGQNEDSSHISTRVKQQDDGVFNSSESKSNALNYSYTNYTTWNPWTTNTTWDPWTRNTTWRPWPTDTTWDPWTSNTTWRPWPTNTTWNPWTRNTTWNPWTTNTTWHPWTRNTTWPDWTTTVSPWRKIINFFIYNSNVTINN